MHQPTNHQLPTLNVTAQTCERREAVQEALRRTRLAIWVSQTHRAAAAAGPRCNRALQDEVSEDSLSALRVGSRSGASSSSSSGRGLPGWKSREWSSSGAMSLVREAQKRHHGCFSGGGGSYNGGRSGNSGDRYGNGPSRYEGTSCWRDRREEVHD